MKRLIIVANRLPMRFEKEKDTFRVFPSEGGLATGLSSLKMETPIIWVGWPGVYLKNDAEKKALESKLDEYCNPVYLTKNEVIDYYEGFSNETIWPLFHCFTEYTRYEKNHWDTYKKVNQKFCDKVMEIAREGDVIWVQDYHLMLLPGLLKKNLSNPIGFFLHIPFPPHEMFRNLPWSKEILNGLISSDLLGFHTPEYHKNFTNSVSEILGFETRMGEIKTPLGNVKSGAFPMGIDFEKFYYSSEEEITEKHLTRFEKNFGKNKIILSIDRLDYTKGILQRLKAYDLLLQNNPELHEKISLVMVTVPSRSKVEKYQHLKEEIDEAVGYINGKYANLDWVPLHYFYRSIPFEQLTALYNLADVGLVTPLKDGMNLVAKEYVACKKNHPGVLILSEFAGAADELTEAIKVNPNDIEDISRAMVKALYMAPGERRRRMEKMQEVIKVQTVGKWAGDFIHELEEVFKRPKSRSSTIIRDKERRMITNSFLKARKKLIILDYDGTLVPYFNKPEDAKPDQELILLLQRLAEEATVLLISGRERNNLEQWFGNLPIGLVAEHGVWEKINEEWVQVPNITHEWKDELAYLLQDFVDKAPGSFIEEKSYSLAFHYRNANNIDSDELVPEMILSLSSFCAINGLEILKGKKVVEIRIAGINKGHAVRNWIGRKNWEFVLAAGDDKTDEDIFRMLRSNVFSIKVGGGETLASFRVKNHLEIRSILSGLMDPAQSLKRYFNGNGNNKIEKTIVPLKL